MSTRNVCAYLEENEFILQKKKETGSITSPEQLKHGDKSYLLNFSESCLYELFNEYLSLLNKQDI